MPRTLLDMSEAVRLQILLSSEVAELFPAAANLDAGSSPLVSAAPFESGSMSRLRSSAVAAEG